MSAGRKRGGGRRSQDIEVSDHRAPVYPESRGGAPGAAGALEELVRTVLALDGERAGALLASLAETLQPRALELLRDIERASRADRHAALARSFASRCAGCGAVDGIPGLLGAEVHRQLAPGVAPTGGPGSGAMVRWARRVALELEPP